MRDPGFLVDRFQWNPRKDSLPTHLQAGIGMMKRRSDEVAVGIEEQVVAGPRVATDALDGLFVRADVLQPRHDFLVQLRDIPLQPRPLVDGQIGEAADLAHRQHAFVKRAKHNAAAFDT